jgi:calcineurin-like phosphoesterase family protein
MKHKAKQTWFISDTHFDHKNILEYSDRPFDTVPEMNETIISNIKKYVRKGDILIVVGDFQLGAKKEALREYIRQIKTTGCTLVLVRGNHDYKNSEMINLGFDVSVDRLDLEIAHERVSVTHFPYRQPVFKYLYYCLMNYLFGKKYPRKWWKERYYWKKLPFREKYHIHGHTHGDKIMNEFQINVSCEAVNYTPINIQKIGELIAKHKARRQKYETNWFRRGYAYVNRCLGRRHFTDHVPRTS